MYWSVLKHIYIKENYICLTSPDLNSCYELCQLNIGTSVRNISWTWCTNKHKTALQQSKMFPFLLYQALNISNITKYYKTILWLRYNSFLSHCLVIKVKEVWSSPFTTPMNFPDQFSPDRFSECSQESISLAICISHATFCNIKA